MRNGQDASLDNVEFLDRDKSDKELLIKESLFVKKLFPDL